MRFRLTVPAALLALLLALPVCANAAVADTADTYTPTAQTPSSLPIPASETPPSVPADRIDRRTGSIVNPYRVYSYALLMEDIAQLHRKYPSLVKVYSLGTTAGGRSIPLLVVGNPAAQKRIWVDATLHAREYMTSQVVMSSLELLLRNVKNGVFEGKRLSEVLQNASLHVAPMLNPDGAELSRVGVSSAPADLRETLIALNGGNDFSRYKANLHGVDLNRNFPSGWASIAPSTPSSLGYKGASPLCEVETAAAARYLQTVSFSMSVSFHCTGGVIYWYYNQPSDAFSRDLEIANGFSTLIGYPLVMPDPTVPVGGLKDFVVETLHIPAITIELRSPKPAPVPQWYFGRILNENALVLWHALNQFG